MNLSLFFEEGLLCLFIGERDCEIDGLIEGDSLSLSTVLPSFCYVFLIISLPLYEKETGKSDVGGGIFEMSLKSDIMKFSINSSVHIDLVMIEILLNNISMANKSLKLIQKYLLFDILNSHTFYQELSFSRIFDNDWYMNSMKGKDFKKEDHVLMAKLAQQTERFEEMINFSDQILLS